MPIALTCTKCGAKIKAPDQLAGSERPCPQCGTSLTVPVQAVQTKARPAAPAPAPLSAKVELVPVPFAQLAPVVPSIEYKNCPFCGEKVLMAAKKCKHCGETIDVSLRAAEESRRMAECQVRPAPAPAPLVVTNISVFEKHGPRKSPGMAAFLEIVFGIFFATFGIGHIYSGHVLFGLFIMVVWWFVLAFNLFLLLVFIGLITLPICWVGMLIISPIMAASNCR